MWIYYVFVLAIVAQGFTAPVTEEHHNRVKRQLLKYDDHNYCVYRVFSTSINGFILLL